MTDLESAWLRIDREAARLSPLHLRELFDADPERPARLSLDLDDLVYDFSKERLDADALAALFGLAEAADVVGRRDALFAGEAVNTTESRAAMHMALRAGDDATVPVQGHDVMPEVRETRDRFLAFAEAVREGSATAKDGEPFTDVVHLGIGGSDLGPAMAAQALAPWHDGPRLHFVSNVDGTDLADRLKPLDPARTLVLVASKSFTTRETLANARAARGWMEEALGDDAPAHFAAISANLAATGEFGIAEDRVFGFWDWVGGRYSIWSAVGLPLAIAIGAGKFREFLEGAREIDRHFQNAPLAQNLPVMMALVGIWRRNGLGCPTVGVMPYDQRLARFPAYLQQLEMESNGKGVTRAGAPAPRRAAPVVWGEAGTNCQHSFFQLLHQGADTIPVDFLLGAEAVEGLPGHHAELQANALAQAAALAFGRTEKEAAAEMAKAGHGDDETARLAPHRAMPGNRPSTMLLYRRLDPATLGRLIALYEHKTFVQGAIWNVNPFDQWGVELGKTLAEDLRPLLEGEAEGKAPDQSTGALIAHIARLAGKSSPGA